MEVLGITGSIATGKSTVTNYLKEKGYLVVDSDKLAYDALKGSRRYYSSLCDKKN